MEQWHDNPHFTWQDKWEIGETIRSLRETLGITQENLSELTGIEAKVISRHENGTMCSVEALTKYAIALGCTVNDLLPGRALGEMKGHVQQDVEIHILLRQLPDAQKGALLQMLRTMIPESA